MATFNWSTLTNGQTVAFNPAADLLHFDQAFITAVDVVANFSSNPSVSLTVSGKAVTFQTDMRTFTTTNVTFAGGSQWLIGDNTIGTANDDGPNTLTGTSGADRFHGLGGDDIMVGGAGNDQFSMAASGPSFGNDTVDGGTGSDTLQYGAQMSVAPAHINLATGSATNAGGNTTLISIETVIGTFANDTFVGGDPAHEIDSFGNTVAERFRGRGGDDSITGGAGNGFFTIVDYSDRAAVTVNLASGSAVGGGTDTLVNIDSVWGGAGNDTLIGGGLSRNGTGIFFEVLRGNAGNDTLNGNNENVGGRASGATDVADYSNNGAGQAVNVNLGTGVALDGLGGTDTLIEINQVNGGGGNDTLTGSAESNERFDGGIGSDIINGGDGSDEVSFAQSDANVIVNLSAASITIDGVTVAAGTANDGMGGTDTLISIEQAHGSDFNDYIRGSDDVAIRETFSGDAGNDTIDGGAGIDFASYANVALIFGGVNAFIENGSGTVNDKLGGTDTLINVEGLDGTNSNDTLRGGLGDQWFRGRGGSDSINGGAGNDWVTYSSDPSGVTINLAGGTAADGFDGPGGVLALGGTDTLVSIENAEGSDYADTITGSNAANELRGRDGNDTLDGGSGNDTLDGGAGNDTLNGGLGTDRMAGGAGDDLYIANNSTDVVIENANEGTDHVMAGGTRYTLGANVEHLTLTGSARDGTGNDLNNVITGNSLANQLTGGSGDDTLSGGLGSDTLDGGLGTDQMSGGAGNDLYIANNSTDVVIENANEGTDHVMAGGTRYTLGANVEHLTLTGSARDGTGNDLDNVITGNSVANQLAGGSGNDTLNGGAGNDTLNGGLGTDRMLGGAGDDLYIANNSTDVVIENANAGTDHVQSGGASHTLGANVEHLTLTGSARDGTGNNLNNVITGNSLANRLTGGSGDDTLSGGLGNDTLDGGLGTDQMSGGAGNDLYIANNSTDVVIENANEGTDHVMAGGTRYTLGANVEHLTLTGSARDGTGNDLDNVITGNSLINTLAGGGGNDSLDGGSGNDILDGGTGNDTLNGGLGTDRMSGGAGDDLYIANNSTDVVIENANAGTDHVQSGGASHTLGANVENLTLTGSARDGTGNNLNNVITGNSVANRLTGGSGDDTLSGGLGSDTLDGGLGTDQMSGGAGSDLYIANNSTDVVIENANEGTDHVMAGGTRYTLGANVEHLTLTGSARDGTGNDLNNVITGNSVANQLSGGAGNDTLAGGLGNDTLTGGEGSDRFVFDTALNGTTNVDRIIDFDPVTDALRLDDVVFTGLTLGTLAASAFLIGTAAQDADDRIIYNAATGAVLFDADGTGAAAAVRFATLDPGLAITNSDFIVV